MRDVMFEIGSDDGVKAWLNDTLVHQNNILRGHVQADDRVKVKLVSGRNDVLLKITQGEGGWRASLVITDLDEKVLTDLEFRR